MFPPPAPTAPERPLPGGSRLLALAKAVWSRLGGPAPAPATGPAAGLPPPAGSTILVVDDEPIVRELSRIALERGGFRVLEARDGLEAVELFRARRETVDLVLLDMTMPRMGGAEAFRRIRELAPGIPVLLTSGYTRAESMEDLADLPPDGFLQKPFRVRQLVIKVQELLGGQRPNFTIK